MVTTTRLAPRTLDGVQHGWLVVDDRTGVTVGWVVKRGREWRSYIVTRRDLQGQRVDWGHFRTRRDAVAEVEIQREV